MASEEWLLYLRKSRADIQAEALGEKETLARHETALLALAKSKNLVVGDIYREVVSGDSIAERPMVQKLIKEVESGKWAGVLVMDIDRLARGDTIDQGIIAQTFRYTNTRIITPSKTYDPNNEFDEEFFEFGLFMARREYKAIKRRMQRGREASVKEGKYVGSRRPFGYERYKLEGTKGYSLKIKEDEAEIIRLVFQLYTVGVPDENGNCERIGISKIVRYLNDLGIKPLRNNVWTPASIQTILQNPVYIGKIRWNFRPVRTKLENGEKTIERPRNNDERLILSDGLHEPIITMEIWEKAQFYMKQNPPRPLQIKNTVQNPLAGLVRCGKCGRSMVRRPYREGKEPGLICPYTSCDNVSSELRLVERRVLSTLRAWANDYQLSLEKPEINPREEQIRIKESRLNDLEKELTINQQKLENVYDYFEKGIYSTDVFLERSQKINAEIDDCRELKSAVEQELKKEKIALESRNEIVPKVKKILEIYWELESPKLKNDMLKEVIGKIDYIKEHKAIRGQTKDDFEITIYPRLPEETL